MSGSSGLLGLSGCGDQRDTGREEFSTSTVERGPSDGARSGSKESSSCRCAALSLTPLHPLHIMPLDS
jgi:hypothetical protein